MKTPLKFVAALTGVREVSLLGTADLRYWQEALAGEGLVPAERDGAAQVMIIAADARFRGIGFREVSFSVLVNRPPDVPGPDAAYLVAAFNSRRLFAWSERVFFSTPYRHAEIGVTASPVASVRVGREGAPAFVARVAPDVAETARPVFRGDGGWEGAVFLPSGGRAARGRGRYFVARIGGGTSRFPFVGEKDCVTVTPSGSGDVFGSLRDSGFAPREWVIREDAAHAKSKTYTKSDVPQRLTV